MTLEIPRCFLGSEIGLLTGLNMPLFAQTYFRSWQEMTVTRRGGDTCQAMSQAIIATGHAPHIKNSR